MLLHDDEHGGALIDALARHGDGLPANVLPLAVNEVTQVGLETIAAAFAYGASAVRFLLRAKPRHDITGLTKTIALAQPILAALGYGSVATHRDRRSRRARRSVGCESKRTRRRRARRASRPSGRSAR